MKYLKDLVKNNIFTVEFVKQDGSTRVMNCSFNIKNKLKKNVILSIKSKKEYIELLNKGFVPIEFNNILLTEPNVCATCAKEFAKYFSSLIRIQKLEENIWQKEIEKNNLLTIKLEKDFINFSINKKSNLDPEKYLIVLDHQKNEIRSINMDTVNWIRFGGIEWSKDKSDNFKPLQKSKI